MLSNKLLIIENASIHKSQYVEIYIKETGISVVYIITYLFEKCTCWEISFNAEESNFKEIIRHKY